jgi:phosphate starvation-inducible PhoH-like protein
MLFVPIIVTMITMITKTVNGFALIGSGGGGGRRLCHRGLQTYSKKPIGKSLYDYDEEIIGLYDKRGGGRDGGHDGGRDGGRGGCRSRKKSGGGVVGGSVVGVNDATTFTKNQQLYVDALNNPEVVVVVVMGSAGTGKTFIGCQWGLTRFLDSGFRKMIITRPTIPVSGEEIGFIPGGISSKMLPWTRPIYDAFLEKDVVNKKMLDKYILDESIEMIPLAFMRGRTFSSSFIFADEMQNSTPEQMLMLLTRIGNNSKIVVSGDLAQSDIDGKDGKGGRVINGLYDFIMKYKKIKGLEGDDAIKIIEFDKEDIRRSKITSTILDIYGGDKL